jgi:hypothetical protein
VKFTDIVALIDEKPPEGTFATLFLFVLRIACAVAGVSLVVGEFLFNKPFNIHGWNFTSKVAMLAVGFGLIFSPAKTFLAVFFFIVAIGTWIAVSYQIIVFAANNFGGAVALAAWIFALCLPVMLIVIGEKIQKRFSPPSEKEAKTD